MVRYRAQLSEYISHLKVIGATFFTSVDTAQHVCQAGTKSAHTFSDQNAVQATFKAQIKTASEIHNAATKAFGPRPIKPIDGQSNGVSQETHKVGA